MICLLKRFIYSFPIILILFIFLSFPSFAANYTLYGNLSSNDTIVSNLIGVYTNQEDYDPFNQYYVARIGQYDYFLFYARDLSEDYKFIRYYGTQDGVSMRYNYVIGSGNHLNVTRNGFMGVGNVPETSAFLNEKQFGFQYVITVLTLLITILILFRTFRRRQHVRSDRGWTL